MRVRICACGGEGRRPARKTGVGGPQEQKVVQDLNVPWSPKMEGNSSIGFLARLGAAVHLIFDPSSEVLL